MEATMTLKKKTSAIMMAAILTVLLISMAVLPAFAAGHPILDVDAKGSITMTHKATDTGAPIEGSTMTLYKVADAVYDDGNAVFEPVSGLDSESIRNAMNALTEADTGAPELALKLKGMLNAAGIGGVSKVTDASGVAKWTDLSVGLYLIVNTSPAEGYEAIPPFLITVPRLLDGEYVYDVETEPKPAPANSVPPEIPPELPQTGQLWWPVPVLAGFGLLLIGIGVYRRKHA